MQKNVIQINTSYWQEPRGSISDYVVDNKIINFNKNQKYKSLPTIQHEQSITEICSQIDPSLGFSWIGTNIVLNNRQSLVLTSDVPAYINYLEHGFDKIDAKWNTLPEVGFMGHDFPERSYRDQSQQTVSQLLATHFNHYHPYRIVRRSNELTLIISGITDQRVKNLELFYQQTFRKFLDFMIFFYDSLMDHCLQSIPLLKFTRFANNDSYRAQFIAGKINLHPLASIKLTPKEIECLYWASRGKTTEDISTILDKSYNTVRHQLNSALNKLGAENIAHAVYLALTHGILF